MLTMVGASGQLSLGKTYAGQYVDVELQEDGSILLKPITVIPGEEAWLHTPEMQAQLERGEAWMREHPPAETDLEALARKLGVEGQLDSPGCSGSRRGVHVFQGDSRRS